MGHALQRQETWGRPAVGRLVWGEGGTTGAWVCCCNCACVRACAHVPVHADEGGLRSRQGPVFSYGLSLPTRMRGSRDHQPLWPHASGLSPHPGEVSGYCSPAFPSIRILLHSCESFSKQTPACKGKEGAGEGERRGWMQTQPRLLAPACSPSMALPGRLVSQSLVPGELWNKSLVSLYHGLAV